MSKRHLCEGKNCSLIGQENNSQGNKTRNDLSFQINCIGTEEVNDDEEIIHVKKMNKLAVVASD